MDDTSEMTVAEVFLKALYDHGIEYIFANAGTDFAPIIEALVTASQKGNPTPKFLTVPHENVAISMAQGYYRIVGKPAGVMVHVTVGTANTICGLMNSSRDNVPTLLMAGRTPLTETGNIGSRNVGIHWGQENFDQGGMVREYVKWDYELRNDQPVDTLIGRALDIANSEPRGPVYLTLPREVLGTKAKSPSNPLRSRPSGSAVSVPDISTLEKTSDLILRAEKPLIVSGKLGCREYAFDVLGAFARDFGLPVTHVDVPALPSGHPMNWGFTTGQHLPEADLILVIESSVPWIPRTVNPNRNCKLIHLSPDPFYARFPYRGFEMDLALSGEPVESLKLLHEIMLTRSKGKKRTINARRKLILEKHEMLSAKRQQALADAQNITPVLPAWVAACINEVKSDNTILVNELGTNIDHLNHTSPGCYVSVGQAGGLGSGLGSALGAKLASRDRDVILMVGDGSYIFGNPTAAHFVGRSENLATLTLIMNNNMWFAVQRSTRTMYPDGLAVKANRMPLTELAPSPDFEKTIEACGGYGERVEDPGKLKNALQRGIEKVRDGQSVLLNVITQPGGRD